MSDLFLRSSMNFHFGDFLFDTENPVGESETIPDMTLSIEELISKHTRGMEVPSFSSLYFEDDYVPDFRTMDIAEREEFIADNKERIKNLQADLKRLKESVKEAEIPVPPPVIEPPLDPINPTDM